MILLIINKEINEKLIIFTNKIINLISNINYLPTIVPLLPDIPGFALPLLFIFLCYFIAILQDIHSRKHNYDRKRNYVTQ